MKHQITSFCIPNRSTQRGVSTLSMAFVVLATGITGVGMSRQAVTSVETSQGKAQGVLLDKLNNAVNTYMSNNFTQVINNAAVAIPTGGTIPDGLSLQPTLGQLQGMGVLDATFQPSAINGGNYQVQIARTPNNCWLAVPNNCNLQSRVWIDQPFLNSTGTAPSTRLVQAAVAAAPGSVGTSNNESPSSINGPTWSLANPVAGTPAGILMAVGGYASSAFANYLPLRGGVMNGGINMGNQTVANASSIVANGAVNAATMTTSGNATFAGTLLAGGNKTQLWNQPSEGGVLTLGDTSGQSMHQELVGGRMRWINGPWNAELGGIDQRGNFNANGSIAAASTISTPGLIYTGSNLISAGPISAGSTISAVSTISTPGQVYAGVSVVTSGAMYAASNISSSGNVYANGDVSSGAAVRSGAWSPVVPGWGVETWGCETGAISKAAYTISDGWAYNGKALSCTNGVWAKAGGGSGGGGAFYLRYTDGACLGPNPVTGGCGCPSGQNPYVTITAVGTYMGALSGYVCN